MLQQKQTAPPPFSSQDQEMILNILINQPLQGMKAAVAMDGLITRFNLFCAKYAAPAPKAPAPPAPPAEEKAGKKR